MKSFFAFALAAIVVAAFFAPGHEPTNLDIGDARSPPTGTIAPLALEPCLATLMASLGAQPSRLSFYRGTGGSPNDDPNLLIAVPRPRAPT